jgi:hypothetical protein
MDQVLKKKESQVDSLTAKKYVAKKDFVIHREYGGKLDHFEIKKGDDLRGAEVLEKYKENLKTEGVI